MPVQIYVYKRVRKFLEFIFQTLRSYKMFSKLTACLKYT